VLTNYGWQILRILKWGQKHVYISFITDAYSKKIVGYNVANTLETVSSVQALEMAIKQNEGKLQGLIHHSDRGVQYCANEYTRVLLKHHIHISMTENSDPRENAIAERINGIMKEEYLNHYILKNCKEVQKQLEQAVILYNSQRPHMSCNMITPNIIHENNIKTQKLWKNYYQQKTIIVNPL
jgi:putative transposase